jgi:hypothetical protein
MPRSQNAHPPLPPSLQMDEITRRIEGIKARLSVVASRGTMSTQRFSVQLDPQPPAPPSQSPSPSPSPVPVPSWDPTAPARAILNEIIVKMTSVGASVLEESLVLLVIFVSLVLPASAALLALLWLLRATGCIHRVYTVAVWCDSALSESSRPTRRGASGRAGAGHTGPPAAVVEVASAASAPSDSD